MVRYHPVNSLTQLMTDAPEGGLLTLILARFCSCRGS